MFLSRSANTVVIRTPDSPHPQEYQLFGVHEFTSDRKRMSVVVKNPDGSYSLLAKGADSVIFARSRNGPAGYAGLNKHLTRFASLGLRTLVVAERHMSSQEFRSWHQEFTVRGGASAVVLACCGVTRLPLFLCQVASQRVNGREAALAEVAGRYETNLRILGATAIEDKLQEGVPQTISDLARAGIKTWVLTGDKVETAINIGHSCHLLNKDMDIVKVGRRFAGAMLHARRWHVCSV